MISMKIDTQGMSYGDGKGDGKKSEADIKSSTEDSLKKFGFES